MNKIDQRTIEKFKKAEELFTEKKIDESIKNYKEILNFNPSFLPALNNIASCYEYLNKLAEAETYYSKCVSLKSDELIFLNNLSNIYLKQKKFNQALPLLKNSLAQAPNQEKVAESFAECLFSLNLKDDLNLFGEQAIKRYPLNEIFPIFYGKNLLKMGKHQEGLKVLKDINGVIEFNEESYNLV